MDVFDLNENSWITPNFTSKPYVELRRNHVSDLIGFHILIHGGISENNKILSDCHALTTSPLKWNMVQISEFTPGPALSGHASAVVLPMDLKYSTKTSLYKFPESTNYGKMQNNKVNFFF